MKKLLLIIAIAICSGTALANEQDTTKVPKQEAVPPNDSTGLITLSDFQQFEKAIISELPAKYADVIREYWRQVITRRFQMYMAAQVAAGKKK